MNAKKLWQFLPDSLISPVHTWNWAKCFFRHIMKLNVTHRSSPALHIWVHRSRKLANSKKKPKNFHSLWDSTLTASLPPPPQPSFVLKKILEVSYLLTLMLALFCDPGSSLLMLSLPLFYMNAHARGGGGGLCLVIPCMHIKREKVCSPCLGFSCMCIKKERGVILSLLSWLFECVHKREVRCVLPALFFQCMHIKEKGGVLSLSWFFISAHEKRRVVLFLPWLLKYVH